MSSEQILVWIVIGGIAGILAEALVGGLRSGLIGAIVVGILGAIIGGWLFGVLGSALVQAFLPKLSKPWWEPSSIVDPARDPQIVKAIHSGDKL